MEIEFGSADLTKLYVDPTYAMGLSPAVAKAFRKRVQFVLAAADERDLRSWKSLRMEKLKADRQHQYSLRLNDQFRLIFEFVGEGQAKRLRIVGVEDYH